MLPWLVPVLKRANNTLSEELTLVKLDQTKPDGDTGFGATSTVFHELPGVKHFKKFVYECTISAHDGDFMKVNRQGLLCCLNKLSPTNTVIANPIIYYESQG